MLLRAAPKRGGGGGSLGLLPNSRPWETELRAGTGMAEKGQLQNEDALTTEHPLRLFKSKTTAVPKAGAFYSPGGEKRLCISPPRACGKMQLGLRLFCRGSPPGSVTARSNTSLGSTGTRQVFAAVVTMEIISGREFQFSVLLWHPGLWLVLPRGLGSSRGLHQPLTVSQSLWV